MAGNKQLRLLVIMNWPGETFLRRLVHGLLDADVNVTVASHNRPEKEARVTWLPLPIWTGFPPLRLWRTALMFARGLLRSPGIVTSLGRSVRSSPGLTDRLHAWHRLLPFAATREQWDVIYLPWVGSAIPYFALFDLPFPVVVSLRGAQINVAPHNPDRLLSERLGHVLGRVSAIHCVSEAIQQEAMGFGLDPKRTHIIRPAVDPNFFKPLCGEETRGNTLRIVTIGSLIWRKGHEYTLLAVQQLLNEGIAVELDIIGDGPERQRVLYTIEDLSLAGHVQVYGHLSPREVRDRLQRADAFLLSSLSEGISNAVLEAMACGLPIVTTDCGGMREAVTDGVEGRVVPICCPHAAASALKDLFFDETLRRQMGRAARKRVERNFDLATQVQQFLDLFHAVSGIAPSDAAAKLT